MGMLSRDWPRSDLRPRARLWFAGLGMAAAVGGADASDAAPPPAAASTTRPQVGLASFYSASEAGKPTASGEPLKLDKMRAASRTLPLGARARVVNTKNGKAVNVTVNDRGPYVPKRIIDVTPKAADKLGMKTEGVAKVEVTPLSKPTGTE